MAFKDYAVEQMRLKRTPDGEQLADNQTLSDAGITDGDSLVIDLLQHRHERNAGAATRATWSPSRCMPTSGTTVGELKQRVAARADGYPVEWQWAELLVGEGLWHATKPGQPETALAHVDDDQPLSYYYASNTDHTMMLITCSSTAARSRSPSSTTSARQPRSPTSCCACG